MRVAATVLPGFGHLNPMVPLLRELVVRGDDVEVIVPPPFVPHVERAGLQATGLGPAWDEAGIEELVPGWRDLDGREQLAVWLDVASHLVGDLQRHLAADPPDVIVHDHFEMAAWVVGERLGIPTVPFAMTIRWLDPTFLALADFVGTLDRFAAAHGLPADGGEARAGRWLYLDALPPSLTRGLLPPTPSVRTIAHEAEDRTGGEDLPGWLADRATDRPLVYVTLGTVFNRRVDVLGALAEGAAKAGADVLLTIGHDGTIPPGLPTGVCVERYVPQTAIYDQLAAVVCHGGFGTVFGAIGAGVPVVCAPLSADQPLNAALVAGAGAGVNLATVVEEGGLFPVLGAGEPTVAAVADAVVRVLDDPEVRRRAAELAGEMASQSSPAQAASMIEDLVSGGNRR